MHPDVAIGLDNYAGLLRHAGRAAEAKSMTERAQQIHAAQQH